MVQLPAMNTPQFGWVQEPAAAPGAAGAADLRARGRGRRDRVGVASTTRREIYVGGSTVAAIVGNKLAPGLGDWYLARTGYDSQQTSEPEVPGRPDNLFAPVDDQRDFGPRGRL